MRGGGNDHVASSEGFLAREAPVRAEQFAGELLEVDLRELIGGTRRLDLGEEIGRGMTGSSQLFLPAGQQVLDGHLRLAVPGGPGRGRLPR